MYKLSLNNNNSTFKSCTKYEISGKVKKRSHSVLIQAFLCYFINARNVDQYRLRFFNFFERIIVEHCPRNFQAVETHISSHSSQIILTISLTSQRVQIVRIPCFIITASIATEQLAS